MRISSFIISLTGYQVGNLDVGLFLLAYCIVYLCSLVGPFLVAKESLILIVSFFLLCMTRMEDYGNKVRIKVLHCHTINGYYKLYSTLLFFFKIHLYILIQRTNVCRCTDYFYLHERVWNGCLILAQFCRTHLDL